MKWINHRLVTFCAVYCLTCNPLYAGFSLLGSTFPDKIEGRPPDRYVESKKYWEWRKKHRGISHWILLYVVFACMVWYWNGLFRVGSAELSRLVSSFIFWFILGCIFHIAEDFICGKVFLFTLSKKYGIKLFSVGSWMEYIYAWFIIGICFLCRFYIGFKEVILWI